MGQGEEGLAQQVRQPGHPNPSPSPSPNQVKKAYLTKCDGDEPLIGDFTVKRESEITGDERTRERLVRVRVRVS